MSWTDISMVTIALVIFVALLIFVAKIGGDKWSLAKKVFLGLLIGVVFGAGIQWLMGYQSPVLVKTLEWVSVVGNGYVYLLQMIIMPLVFVCILSGIAKLHNVSSMGKIGTLVIGILLVTTFIAALVGVLVTHCFGLTADGLTQGTAEAQRLNLIQDKYIGRVENLTVPQLLLSFLPQNAFLDLTGARPTSVIAVVVFSGLLGVAAIRLRNQDEAKGAQVFAAIDTVQAWVLWLVRLVIKLTPYGVLALVTKMVASSDIHAIIKLGGFLLASYVAILLMFIIHAVILRIGGVNPILYLRKVWPVLSFAFVSRSSAASIPLNIEAQTQRLGVPESIASVAASLGATIGQNGCAGVYPAMLAAMIAPTMGINPLDPAWLLTLAVVVTLSSVGIAGVGGGATFAALVVLPIMGFPITLVALLISIEPLIDMARTALNVNDSMLAGTLTSQVLGQTDRRILEAETDVALTQA